MFGQVQMSVWCQKSTLIKYLTSAFIFISVSSFGHFWHLWRHNIVLHYVKVLTMELNLAPWIKKGFKMRKKLVLMDFKRTSVDQKRDELDAKMVSRPFKVNLYLEFDLIEPKNRETVRFNKYGNSIMKKGNLNSSNNRIFFLIMKCSIFWVQF